MRIITRLLAPLVLGAAVVATGAQAATASPTSSEIEYALSAVPGGVQTAVNQVTWQGGTILSVGSESSITPASAPCPSGKFCAFSGPSGTGSRLEFTACPSSNGVGALRQVLSIGNSRSSGVVTGRQGGIVLISVYPGGLKNVSHVIDNLTCVP